jgi:hypothetical protein
MTWALIYYVHYRFPLYIRFRGSLSLFDSDPGKLFSYYSNCLLLLQMWFCFYYISRLLWFNEKCSELWDQRKQAKQWLQEPSKIKRDYLKVKINELEMHSKNKNIRYLCRGINEFKKVYQPRTNLVKDENDDLLADSYNFLNRWKNCSLSYWMYIGTVLLDRYKYIQLTC